MSVEVMRRGNPAWRASDADPDSEVSYHPFGRNVAPMSDIDNDKLGALVGKMLGDLGGAFSVPTVRIGFRLGLFDALHRHGAARISELAGRTGLAERYVREWAFAQAANGYIAFDAEQEQFSLTPEQAMVFANKDSPVYLEGAFDLAVGHGRRPEQS